MSEKTDAERLNWLERQDLNNLVFDRQAGRVALVLGTGVVHGKTLRDAIDAAMRDTP